MGYIHPSLRAKMFPDNVAAISQAIQYAKQLDPRKCDCRPLMALCAALPAADPDILADMQTRMNAVLGYEYTIRAAIPPGATSPLDADVQRASEMVNRFRSAKLHNTMVTLLKGRFNGDAIIELTWGTDEQGQNTVVAWESVQAVDIIKWPDAATGYARAVYPSFESDAYGIMPYDEPTQILVAHSNPMEGDDNAYRGGLFRTALWYAFLKINAWLTWSRAGERTGVLSFPAFRANSEALGRVWSFLQTIVDNAVELPNDMKLEILELLNSAPDVKMYSDLIDKVTSKTQRLLLGQDVTNEKGTSGSLALGKESNKTTADIKWSDLIWLQNVYNDQWLRTDYNLNYGPPKNGLYPEWEFVTAEREDYKQNSTIISQMASAGFTPVDEEEVSRKVGIKMQRTAAPVTPVPGQ